MVAFLGEGEGRRKGPMERAFLDVILVPTSLVVMFGYHLFLLYRILRKPESTVVGYENHNKMEWVKRMMQGGPEATRTALMVIATNVSAATYAASLSIALASLIGAWIGSNSLSSKLFAGVLIYGDASASTLGVKYVTLLACFLLAFTFFIQSARHFIHANFLISTPDSEIPVSYVQRAVVWGGNFWSLGLRALYFATIFLLWIFGPIPMFLSSLVMVPTLHLLDCNSTPLLQFGAPTPKKGTDLREQLHLQGYDHGVAGSL